MRSWLQHSTSTHTSKEAASTTGTRCSDLRSTLPAFQCSLQMSFPVSALTADSSADVICRHVTDLHTFHVHRRWFRSKRWADQLTAISAYRQDRGYPPYDLATAYRHYRLRTLWRLCGEGAPHAEERPLLRRERGRRQKRVACPPAYQYKDSRDSDHSFLSPTLSPSSSASPASPSLVLSGLPSHLAAAAELSRAVSSVLTTDPLERYKAYHEETKVLDAVYQLYRKHCDLMHGADRDTVHLAEKRERSRAIRFMSGSDGTVTRACRSPIMAFPSRCQQDTESVLARRWTRVLAYLCVHAPPSLRMGKNSVFLDVGSGYGKCVLQARVRGEVRQAIGIEYVATRHVRAVEMVDKHVRLRFPSFYAHVEPERHVQLVEGDATDEEHEPLLRSATHVFMFDWVFSQRTREPVLLVLQNSAALAVLVCCQPPPAMQAYGMTLLQQLTLRTTGKQTMTCYCYARN